MLPASGVTGDDVEAVTFTQVLRGYKTSEVDWVLDRLGQELDLLRGQLAAVQATQNARDAQDARDVQDFEDAHAVDPGRGEDLGPS